MCNWVAERIPEVARFGPALATVIERNGSVAAAVVWDTVRLGHMCIVNIAADDPRWATKHVITYVLAVPFTTCNVRRVTALTRMSNHRARKLLEGVGFKREGTHRDGFPDDDLIVYGLTRRFWKRSKWANLQIYANSPVPGHQPPPFLPETNPEPLRYLN